MNKRFSFMPLWISLVAVFATLAITSCNKTFDSPPISVDPNLHVTTTIAELKSRYTAAGVFQSITSDEIISGVVVADDRSGNFYKQVIIQDETGGIPILIDAYSLYNSYPVGRRIYVKLKGMMLGDYGGTIQVGLDSSRSDDGRYLNLNGIPQAIVDSYIVKGSFGNKVTPKVIKISDFNGKATDPLLSTLIQIDNAEFRSQDFSKTYADPTKKTSAVNFTVNTCDEGNIVLRNSSYASFAGIKVPEGNGSLIGVPNIFNGTLQLTIRDTSDVKFTSARCDSKPVTPISISDLLKYATGDSSIPAGTWIEGTLISDTRNEASGNYRLQDGAFGIQLYFDKGANPEGAVLGDKLQVNVGKRSFSVYKGSLQISGVNTSRIVGKGTATPREATIAQIAANVRAWESTLVTIKGVTFTKASVSATGTNYTVKDATGELVTFVRATSNINVPLSAESVTGYISVYQPDNDNAVPQLVLRTEDDFTGAVSAATFSLSYGFDDVKNNSGTTDPTAPPTFPGLTFGSFTAVGVSANSSAGGRFSFSGWPVGEISSTDGDVDLTKYYEVTITPASDVELELSNITFTLQRSSTGTRQVVVRSSLDNYASNLAASTDPTNTKVVVVPTNVFQATDESFTTAINGLVLTPGASFKGIKTPVTFRFYGYKAKASGGTFSIDNVKFEGFTK
ncbi:MAG: DUF5689 domain-containing protein [Niabella sp.]